MTSIETMLRRSGGVAAGVPVLRHALALAVLFGGAVQVNARFGTLRQGPLGIVPMAASTMLLAVTGFLLAQSAGRGSGAPAAGRLLYRYGRRLLPPLFASLVVTVFVLGAFATTIGRRRYLGMAETWRYIANGLGWSSPTLPGVFEFNNASGTVNANLWLVPVLLAGCGIAALAATASPGVRRALFAACLVATGGAALAVDQGWLDPYALRRGARPLLDASTLAGAAGLILGMMAHAWRRRLPVQLPVAVSAAVVVGFAALAPQLWASGALGKVLLAVPLAYLAVTLAVASLPTPWPLGTVNYAVGMVLLAYPVEQSCVMLGGVDQPLAFTFLLTLPATLLLAAASWHLIERPLLGRSRGEAVVGLAGARSRRPVVRPVGWYAGRLRRSLPGLLAVVVFAAVILALMALTMFALQRERPGM